MADTVYATASGDFWRLFQHVVLGNVPHVVQWSAVLAPDGTIIAMGAWGAVPGCKSVRGWGGKGKPTLTRKRGR